jgi:hypothetical protein
MHGNDDFEIVDFMSRGTPLASLARTNTQSLDMGSVVDVTVHAPEEKHPVMSVQDAGALKRDMEEARCNTSGRLYSLGSTKSSKERGGTRFMIVMASSSTS